MGECMDHVKTASNEVIPVIGETEEVMVSVEGHTCRMSFLVLDMDDHEVLLGLNWFEKTGAGIFPSEKILRFPGHTVHLLKDESNYDSFDEPLDLYLSEVVDEDDIVDNSEWDASRKPVFEPAVPLSMDQLRDFKKLLKENKDLFALSIDDLGVCAVRAHKILLTNDEPIFLHPYRKSTSERREIQI